MKKKLICKWALLICLLVSAIEVSAQNANRNGWIFEVQGGQAIGTLYQTEKFNSASKYGYRMAGGFYGGIDFGYRWATSTNCAVEAKLDVSDIFQSPKMIGIGLMPGFRYTTKEILKNTSVYIGINGGLSLLPACDAITPYIPIEFNVGFNLSHRFSIGMFYRYNIVAGSYKIDVMDKSPSPNNNHYDEYGWEDYRYYYAWLKSYSVIGLKLGFRF